MPSWDCKILFQCSSIVLYNEHNFHHLLPPAALLLWVSTWCCCGCALRRCRWIELNIIFYAPPVVVQSSTSSYAPRASVPGLFYVHLAIIILFLCRGRPITSFPWLKPVCEPHNRDIISKHKILKCQQLIQPGRPPSSASSIASRVSTVLRLAIILYSKARWTDGWMVELPYLGCVCRGLYLVTYKHRHPPTNQLTIGQQPPSRPNHFQAAHFL